MPRRRGTTKVSETIGKKGKIRAVVTRRTTGNNVRRRARSGPVPRGVLAGNPLSTLGRAIAPAVGGLAGLAVGGMSGMRSGVAAGGMFNKMIGAGAYRVEGSRTSRQIPWMHGDETSFRVVHKEYIKDISSDTVFTLQSLFVNPGLQETFPWLSTLAANFEQYRFRGLVFMFRSMSANALNSTNTALGTIILAADYNANSVPPLNKTQMEQSMWAVSGKPAEDLLAPIECARPETALTTMYIRTVAGDASGSHDIRFTDLCRFDIAATGSQADANVGELWVSYDVDLIKPVMNFGAPSSVYTAHYRATSDIANATPLGTQVSIYDNMGLSITNSVITIPAQVTGLFNLVVLWAGAAVVGAAPTVLFGGSATGHGIWQPSAGSSSFSTGGTTAQVYLVTFDVAVSASSSYVQFGITGAISTTSCDILVSQMNSSVPVGLAEKTYTTHAKQRLIELYSQNGLDRPYFSDERTGIPPLPLMPAPSLTRANAVVRSSADLEKKDLCY